MLADFCIPRLSNDMKMVVQKNHFGGQILNRSLDHSEKNGVEELSDRPVAPDYSSDESESFNHNSEVYLKSSSRSLTLSK